jgi:chromate transporter
MAIHIGHARGGWPGLVVAGVAFILPATLIVCTLAWAYVRYSGLPDVAGVLYGVKPVVMAVVVQALWRLGRSALKTRGLAVLALASILAVAAGVHELVVLGLSGALAAAGRAKPFARGAASRAPGLLMPGAVTVPAAVAASSGAALTAFGLWPLFLVFAKVGAVLFGSGYVLLAFLRADLVERLHWLTERQLLDAIAVGQVTPGPVFTTATFIGYVLGGTSGAGVATVGIFLPAFVFVALSGLVLPRLRRSPTAGAVLDGVNVASLALMVVVSWQLGRSALVDPLTVGLAIAAAIALFRYQVNSAWLVAAGGALGWVSLLRQWR